MATLLPPVDVADLPNAFPYDVADDAPSPTMVLILVAIIIFH